MITNTIWVGLCESKFFTFVVLVIVEIKSCVAYKPYLWEFKGFKISVFLFQIAKLRTSFH